MMMMIRTLREERETVIKLKSATTDGKLPMNMLLEGGSAMKDALASFSQAKSVD